ncbi:hypothetical protein ABH931_001238 [Streptacidiphilus sp. MAP12-33]|uniref:hypothetical protein n=1 Tax=Streptacidiphilus sp. MAP12-33 TaxID=3156266 RepID=UPI003512B4D6
MRAKQAFGQRGADRLKRWIWRYAVPFFALVLIAFSALDIGPAWAAHLGHGTRGTFTATSVSCDKSCFYTGDFVSTDGSVTRHGVGMDSGAPSHVGGSVPALDTGDRVDVFPADGGSDWMTVSLVLLAAVAVLGVWTWQVPLLPLRRRRAAARAYANSGKALGA